MTGWNLPPGVNESDIPGNRPLDEAIDKLCSECDLEPCPVDEADGDLEKCPYKVVEKAEDLLADNCPVQEIWGDDE